jgi:zinc D-Ala-D-Ala carboxypeptidase
MRKVKAGTHSKGIASDIRIHSGSEGFVIVSKAIKMGFRGIGVAKTFIHLDVRKTMPVIWSY